MKIRRKLKNLKVTHVSYVDRGANKKSYYLTKDAEGKEPDFEFEVKLLCSANEEERLVYGIVYSHNEVDAHNDYTDEDTLRKAAHNYLAEYRKMDVQHNFQEESAGVIVESSLAPTDYEINGEFIKKGTWVIVSKASPEIWERIKKGELNAYSLAGTAETEYERVKAFDLIKQLFSSKKSVTITNMEVEMDEELRKALENLSKATETIDNISKSVGTIVEKVDALIAKVDAFEPTVKKFEELDIAKQIKESVEAVNVEVKKNMDSVSEAIVNSVHQQNGGGKDDSTPTTETSKAHHIN